LFFKNGLIFAGQHEMTQAMKLATPSLALALLLPLPAFADPYVGTTLLHDCEQSETGNDVADLLKCASYIAGVADALSTISSQTPSPSFCANDATYTQERAVVLKFLKEHPRDLHYSAASLILKALLEAYPCNTSQAPPQEKQEKQD
jgi:hypothetical protein